MRIGRYETVRLLGKGGMSEVYEVEDPHLGSRHALKLFTYEKDETDVRERFLTEGRILARLNHPRVVHVTDFGTDAASGRPYFVMDLVVDARGQTRSLGDVQPGTADEEEIGRWYDDLRDGLAYIHANGVIHRDLKIQNVLIGPDGHAVLTDFGISKVFDAKGEGKPIVDTVNTIVKLREGRSLVMGSIGYMAPELEMGVAASPQSDWYALGVIAYHLLTGHWCDSRTDVVGTLESYDAVWKKILPKLLHSNPSGRECLSYAEEKSAERERNELEWEERWLTAKSRGRRARHFAKGMTAVVVVLLATIAVLLARFESERRVLKVESRLSGVGTSPYDFDEVFKIPPTAKAEARMDEQGDVLVPSREELAMAQVDLLVITHELFAGLVSGKITVEKAIADLERLQEGFALGTEKPFDKWPNGYLQVGNDEVIYWFLNLALERLRGLSES